MPQDSEGPPKEKPEQPKRRRAAIYVRMSTEHQQYSTENQSDVIQDYAARHGIDIVRTYSDGGKSGLVLSGRDSLQQMIDDVQSEDRDFEDILVYDVSRWGRFQDTDESAHYEFICRKAGVSVHYCAEQFVNDGSPVSTIVKGVKRAMAAEYSRELSTKVFQGQCRLIQLGYRQGGVAGYGLRRVLVAASGDVKGMLDRGEHKSIQTDRVILQPGPEAEVATVRWMYDQFLSSMPERDIAATLNAQGLVTDYGRAWTRGTVHQVLTNEKYVGNNVFNRVSFKLKQKRVVNPPDLYVRADGVYQAIVPPEIFAQVQQIIAARCRRLSNDELLGWLKDIYQRHGELSALIIDEYDGPSSGTFQHRFGSLLRAYHLVGYVPEHDYSYIEINRQLRQLYPKIVTQIVNDIENVGAEIEKDANTDLLCVNDEFTLTVVIARCLALPSGVRRWVIRFDTANNPDLTVAVRMEESNTFPQDYYLLPAVDMRGEKLRLAEQNGLFFDSYRFDTLAPLVDLARRVALLEVA